MSLELATPYPLLMDCLSIEDVEKYKALFAARAREHEEDSKPKGKGAKKGT